jgi:hypothetical protein
MPVSRWTTLFAALASTLMIVGTAVAEAPRIIRVEELSSADSAATGQLQMPKFQDAAWQQPGDEFVVTWKPNAEGSPVGTTVRFQYRQQRRKEIRTLEVTYPFVVNQSRSASFAVIGEAYQRGGRVTAWRVQILEGGRIAAERRSPDWS